MYRIVYGLPFDSKILGVVSIGWKNKEMAQLKINDLNKYSPKYYFWLQEKNEDGEWYSI